MADSFYPSIDVAFLIDQIEKCPKLIPDSIFKIGSTTCFVLDGNKPLPKRTFLVRELDEGQINFEQAMYIAIKLSCMGVLMKWLEEHRDWKEGAFIVPPGLN